MAKRRGNHEGSIYRRKDGRWVGAIMNTDGRRKAFYGETRAEAVRLLREAQTAIDHGLPITGGQQQTGAFLDVWLTDSATRLVRPRTLQGYEQIIRHHLKPALGRVPLVKLTPQHVERMMNDAIKAGRSPQSVCHDRAVLRRALNVAMRWGLVGRNVASLTDPPRVPEHEQRALTATDARRILTAVRGCRLEGLFTVALAAGLRQSEALGLRWSDVDLDAGRLSVRRVLQRYGGAFHLDEPKTKRSRRTLKLPAPVITALREHRVRQLEERMLAGGAWKGDTWGDLVFSSEAGGPLHGTTVGKQFRDIVSTAGYPDLKYHHLRHGAASLMAAQGVPARLAMETLGHSQISTTMQIYTHVAPESLDLVAEKMEQAIWGVS